MTELANIHPGVVLLEEFLKPIGLSQNRLAREIGVPPRRARPIATPPYPCQHLASLSRPIFL